MAKRLRDYSAQDRQLALIFYERIRHNHAPDADGEMEALRETARVANVEVAALRFWIGGGDEREVLSQTLTDDRRDDRTDPDSTNSSDDEWEPPADMPEPPDSVIGVARWPEQFLPAYDLERWAFHHFLKPEGELYNPEHGHLLGAQIAFEWTNVQMSRQGNLWAAGAELIGGSGGNKWTQGRDLYHLQRAWAGHWPDNPNAAPIFRITVDAPWWAGADAASRCATIDHEYYHCYVKMKDGEPQMDRDGRPKWTIRGHEVEQFIGVRRRWGAVAAGTSKLEACAPEAMIAVARIRAACGACAHW